MASTIFFVNLKGDEVVSRHFRNDISKQAMDAFRNKIVIAKATGQNPPVVRFEETTFLYIRHSNLYVVAATKGNPNAALIFEYLYQKIRILKSYLGEHFTDESLTSNFTLLYEIFDETMDYGYPQNCAVDVLHLYVNNGTVLAKPQTGGAGAALTSQITGAIDWRRDGLRYRRNQVYIDVMETVALLTSTTGAVLRAEIHGKVMMKTQLSGMPECKFGLNDKLIMEKEGGGAATAAAQNKGVEIDDCTFHRCVRLGKFDAERTITFIPPDGEFELMSYRVTSPSQPFRIMNNISEEGKTKVTVNIRLSADFSNNLKAENVVVKIPMPPTAAKTRVTAGKGHAKYVPGKGSLIWTIPSFPGGVETALIAIVDLLPATREKPWVRPPISLNFNIPMHSASGVHVRFLKVYEKSNYQTTRWVRYLTKAGEYEARI
jgi:AP-2 complex subunit mu-1